MKKLILILIAALSPFIATEASNIDFNSDWKFILEDIDGANKIDINDATWRKINLPHDWAYEAGYVELGGQKDKGGYGIGGVAWYRKHFDIDTKELTGKSVFIDFEAVYMNSEVWVNGHYLGKRPYGYIPFSYEIGNLLKDGENIIAVRVDNALEPSARWYHGCGIYGNVTLRVNQSAYFEKDGTFVQTPTMGEVAISSEIISQHDQTVEVRYSITDNKGKRVAKGKLSKVALSDKMTLLPISASVKNPNLWSPESPALYTLDMEIRSAKSRKILDEQSIRFGFRTIEWDAKTGMHLNGKQYKLRGVCEHLEGGPVGAYSPESIVRWKMQKIKDMGCNAVRFTHNPFLPIYYEVCDQIGLLVMDEVFDGWRQKADYDYGLQAFDEWWERDLTAWIRRDRNHPSVFIYSVGNETTGDIAPSLVAACHKVDSTRMVTSGDCNPDDMDVYGVNGRSEKIDDFISVWDQHKPFIATENPHTWQVRGFYRTQTWYRDGYPNVRQGTQYVPNLTDKEIFAYDWTAPKNRRSKKQVFNSSYDNAFVRVTARHLIEVLRDKEWFSGSFRWTGFDYRGEAGYVHGGWPFKAFQSGTLDVAGFEKDHYYLYQSQWLTEPMIHILPHWTHPVMEHGTEIPVWVYSNGDEVELIVNGKSLGRKKRGTQWNKMQFEWLVPWAEGKVEAIAYKDGHEVARTCQQSSGAPSQLGIEVERFADDFEIVTISSQDSNSVLYPYGENRVYAKMYGDAHILSFDSGSPVDIETPFEAESKCSFMGLNRMFIAPTSHAKGDARVIIGSILGDKKLMLSDKISIDVKEVSLRGKATKRNFAIRYTTDGSEPTEASKLYSTPFSITMGTTVRASVFDNGELIFTMQERFAEDEGLYWGVAGEAVCEFSGLQAEEANLEKAYKYSKYGDGFYATGYVLFSDQGGSITFYQENDGSSYDAKAKIRYAQQTDNGTTTRLEVFNNDVSLGIVEFSNTGSKDSHWGEAELKLTIHSGANNIRLVSLDAAAPTIDQMELVIL